ncbi:MAG: polymer-forming cytoskeletal protein [candidate division Zixibacteria bacterium]|nr:polymer-forming cytoskeletal protein [candidate division Zixibacteria bacterium]
MLNRRDKSMKESDSLNTIIGKGSTISGNLDVQGSLRVDGTIKGEVKCSDLLTVGSTGLIEGEVMVRELMLGGRVTGNIKADDKIELKNKSVVDGDIKTKSLLVEPGAKFNGNCDMEREAASKPTETKQKT